MSAWRAVFWSFLGVRRGRDLEHDAGALTPARVILAGMLGAVVLVLALFGLAYWATR